MFTIIGPFSPIHFLSIFTIWSVCDSYKISPKWQYQAAQNNDEIALYACTYCNRFVHITSWAHNECGSLWSLI